MDVKFRTQPSTDDIAIALFNALSHSAKNCQFATGVGDVWKVGYERNGYLRYVVITQRGKQLDSCLVDFFRHVHDYRMKNEGFESQSWFDEKRWTADAKLKIRRVKRNLRRGLTRAERQFVLTQCQSAMASPEQWKVAT